jgi:hypothetical protein
VEFCATLDALDEDLGTGGGHPSAPIRLALGKAPAWARRGPRFAECAPESHVSDAELHAPLPRRGPDRVWEGIDRAALRTATQRTFARVGGGVDRFAETI